MTTEEYLERLRINDLFTRYYAAIDDKQFDVNIIKAIFTGDARIIKPNGLGTLGCDNINDANKKSFARFKATHHVTSDYIIDIAGDTASVRANLTGMHLWADDERNPTPNNKHFYAGIVLAAKVNLVNNNWLISELVYRNVWRTGEGLAEMAKFGRPKE